MVSEGRKLGMQLGILVKKFPVLSAGQCKKHQIQQNRDISKKEELAILLMYFSKEIKRTTNQMLPPKSLDTENLLNFIHNIVAS